MEGRECRWQSLFTARSYQGQGAGKGAPRSPRPSYSTSCFSASLSQKYDVTRDSKSISIKVLPVASENPRDFGNIPAWVKAFNQSQLLPFVWNILSMPLGSCSITKHLPVGPVRTKGPVVSCQVEPVCRMLEGTDLQPLQGCCSSVV